MFITTITTKMFSVFFYLYMFLIILSNSMAIAESFFSKYPYLELLWYQNCFFVHNLLVWSHYYNFIKEFNNLFYLFMSIVNGTSYHAYNCMPTENSLKLYLCSIIKLPKITKVNIFLFLSITNLLPWCSEIETKILNLELFVNEI